MADSNQTQLIKRRRERPPVRVTPEQLEDAIEALEDGVTLTAHCAAPGRPTRRSIVRAIAGDPVFCERFQRARDLGFDVLAEEVLQLVDQPIPKDDKGRTDVGLVQQRRLQMDARLKLLSKWCSARYGTKVQVGGDPDAPLLAMTDSEVMHEVLALLAVAQGRQLADEQPRRATDNGQRVQARSKEQADELGRPRRP